MNRKLRLNTRSTQAEPQFAVEVADIELNYEPQFAADQNERQRVKCNLQMIFTQKGDGE